MYIKTSVNAIVPNAEVTEVRRCSLRRRQGLFLRILDKRNKTTCIESALIFNPLFSLEPEDYQCTVIDEVYLFVCPQGVAVCRADYKAHDGSINVASISMLDDKGPPTDLKLAHSVVCLSIPLCRDIKDASSTSINVIQAQLLTISAECIAVMCEYTLSNSSKGYLFELINFRQQGTPTAVLSIPVESGKKPISFYFGWDAPNPEALSMNEFVNGETFETLVEFLTLTICFQDGSFLDYVPILPSCSDLQLPAIYQKSLSLLGSMAEDWSADGLTYDHTSLTKITVSLARLGDDWKSHAMKFRSVEFPSPSDENVSILTPAVETRDTLESFLVSGQAYKVIPVLCQLDCILERLEDKTSLSFVAIQTLEGIDDVDCSTIKNSAEFNVSRLCRRTLVHRTEVPLIVDDARCIILADHPALVLVTSKSAHCLHLHWVIDTLLKDEMQNLSEFNAGRSLTLVQSSDGSYGIEIWNAMDPYVTRVPLRGAKVQPDSGSTPHPTTTNASNTLSSPPRSPYYTWLDKTCHDLDNLNVQSKLTGHQYLKQLVEEMRAADEQILSPMRNALLKLGIPLGAAVVSQVKYPSFLESRMMYCNKLLDTNMAGIQTIRDTNEYLLRKIERIKELEGEISTALSRLRNKMYLMALEAVLSRMECHISPLGGAPLGSGLGLLRDLPLFETQSVPWTTLDGKKSQSDTHKKHVPDHIQLPLTTAAAGFSTFDLRFGHQQPLRTLEQQTAQRIIDERSRQLGQELQDITKTLQLLRDRERSATRTICQNL